MTKKAKAKLLPKRLNLELPNVLYVEIRDYADGRGISIAAVVRRSFSLLMEAERARGRHAYLGIASDAAKLDKVLVGLSDG